MKIWYGLSFVCVCVCGARATKTPPICHVWKRLPGNLLYCSFGVCCAGARGGRKCGADIC